MACNGPGTFNTNDRTDSPITTADIAYSELVERYNATVDPFHTLWVRTDVVIEWYEEGDDGGRNFRREFGDGKFIFRRPGDTVLTVEKVGKVLLWAGSNDQRYWLFDLVDSDNETAYVGAFDQLDAPGRRPFPLPVRPDAVPYLLGLMPLPTATELGTEPVVELYNGRYLVEVNGLRMLVDPRSFRPARVDLLDSVGYSVLTSKLSGRFEVAVSDLSATEVTPMICERAEVFVSGFDSRLTVRVDAATTDASRLRAVMFDFDMLQKALGVVSIETLDRQ